jgi:uncharacterized protein YecE (DUF72 family)
MHIYLGCAGWNLRKEFVPMFPVDGTHLERYAHRLNCVEINSSFYRPHRTSTYRRWAASTPSEFRFAVKLPKQITHVQRLSDAESHIKQFSAEICGLEEKLGAVLAQLPPSLRFESALAESFFNAVREVVGCAVICEPRHPSWFELDAESLMQRYAITRAAADPSVVPAAAIPGGCHQTAYFRWHGSPRMYYSSYDGTALRNLGEQIPKLATCAANVWCIFDNTAEGFAVPNALEMNDYLIKQLS